MGSIIRSFVMLHCLNVNQCNIVLFRNNEPFFLPWDIVYIDARGTEFVIRESLSRTMLDSLLFTLVSGYYVETKGSKSEKRPHGSSGFSAAFRLSRYIVI